MPKFGIGEQFARREVVRRAAIDHGLLHQQLAYVRVFGQFEQEESLWPASPRRAEQQQVK